MSAALAALLIGFSAASGRLAFDSIVQRDAPEANRGRAFAQFETRFQLAWVAAAFVPVIIKVPPRLGFSLLALLGAFGVVSFLAGANHLRQRGTLPPSLGSRAGKELRRRRAARRRPVNR